MAEILEKEQCFQLHALKFFLICREDCLTDGLFNDYCLTDGLLLVKSRDAHHLPAIHP